MNKIIGTAGHIDHGKSSLVQALTGTNPDRLPEEKERGVTIELGFAHLSLPAKGGQTIEAGLIDVPGHADFVNNMVSGVAALDLALLVVAADDGWMPQTEEHLQILAHLRIPRLLIALTKTDLVDSQDDLDFVTEMIREELAPTPFADAEILPVSSHSGQGLDALREKITSHLTASPAHLDHAHPHLPIDRAFSIKGVGTVVTGTLSSGSVNIGDTLHLQPHGHPTTVRGIQTYSSSVDQAQPGTRTALQLSDLQLATDSNRQGVKKGLILSSPNLPQKSAVTDTIDVHLSRLDKAIPRQPATQKPLNTHRKITLHHGSAHLDARLILLETKQLLPGQHTHAQLRLDKPHHFRVGDRLILRDGTATLAGAIVLDPQAHRRALHKEHQHTYLHATHEALLLSKAKEKNSALLLALLTRNKVLTHAQIQAHLLTHPDQTQALITQLRKKNQLLLLESATQSSLADPTWWKALAKTASTHVQDFHKSNTDLPGIETQDLRKLLSDALPPHEPKLDDALWNHLVDELAANDHTRKGTRLSHDGHSLELPPSIAPVAEEISATLDKDPLNPPIPADLAPTANHQKALDYLLRTGRLLKLDDKVILTPAAYAAAKETVIAHLKTHGSATASDLRQALNTSRKVTMPLLEKIDAEGLTQRNGNDRTLTPA